MKNIVTAIALAFALPAATNAAPASPAANKVMGMNCISHMPSQDMSKMDMKGMDMKGHDMAGMAMPRHDMAKMQSCASAAQKGTFSAQDAHSNHAR